MLRDETFYLRRVTKSSFIVLFPFIIT